MNWQYLPAVWIAFAFAVTHGFRCESDEFPCADGTNCTNASLFCDGYPHCSDKSDEPWPGIRRFTYNETASTCESVHTGWVCNSTVLDRFRIDYCREQYLGRYIFRCLSNDAFTIPKSKVCNDVFDCFDSSDECICSWNVRPEQCKHCTPGSRCNNTEYMRNLQDNSTYRCPVTESVATKCDGIRECPYFWDEECKCDKTPKFCQRLNSSRRYGARCVDEDRSIYGDEMCDGNSHCNDSSDEHGCSSWRICDNNHTSLNRSSGINGHPSATNERTDRKFCCKDDGRLKYISRQMVCDGNQDCKNGSDECQKCIKSAFSDDSSMLSSKILVAFVFLISIVALAGGFAVVTFTVRDLMQLKKGGEGMSTTGHTKIIKILILNLSISDLLVAVYTLVICIRAVEFTEGYCRLDRSWRSSRSCSALGATLMIGSEQSVFTMVLIAMQRLYAVMRPFSPPNIRRTIMAVVVSWVISIALGLIPLIPRLEDYFVSSIMFSENKIFKTMSNTDTDYMISWLGLLYPNTTIGNNFGVTNWSKIRNLTAEVNPNIAVKYEFGYYSSHTVCLPTFFPDQLKDTAWGYTLFLLLINFIAFLFMAICYILLYRTATQSKALEQPNSQQQMRDQENAKMQRKLTRIVLSDFVCWMPICLMGFLQLADVDIPKDAYLPAGLFIVPINSALNPCLYSALPEILMEKCELIRRRCGRRAANPQEVIEMAQL